MRTYADSLLRLLRSSPRHTKQSHAVDVQVLKSSFNTPTPSDGLRAGGVQGGAGTSSAGNGGKAGQERGSNKRDSQRASQTDTSRSRAMCLWQGFDPLGRNAVADAALKEALAALNVAEFAPQLVAHLFLQLQAA